MPNLKRDAVRLLTGLFALSLAACGGTAVPSAAPSSAAAKPASAAPASASAAAKPAASGASAKPAGSAAAAKPAASGAGLDSLVAAAKQEGKVTIGFSPNPPMHDVILPAFEKQYGIQVEQVQQQASALATKLIQEKAAGIHSVDVYVAATSSGPMAYDGKLYAPLKPLLLPETTDTSKWVGGKVPYADKEETYVIRQDRQIRPIVVVNPNMVNADALKTPQDLLKPEYKGKIGAFDPTTPGAGQSVAANILKIMGPDYFKSLYVDQQVKFSPEQRVLGDWVAHGTYPIVIGLPVDEYVSVKGNGLPVARAKPGELTATITSVLYWGYMDGAQHPNASKLFLNWILSKEGSQAVVDNMQVAVNRADVDYAKLNPEDVPQAGTSYFDEGAWDYITGDKIKLIDQLRGILASNK